MATIDVSGETYEVEILSGQNTQPRFSLRIAYATPSQETSDIIDVDSRRDLTVGLIEQRLQQWADDHGNATITGFEIVEKIPARRGEPTEPIRVEPESAQTTPEIRERVRGVGSLQIHSVPDAEPPGGAHDYDVGDHIAYRVETAGSSVYNHTTDGIIEAVPSYRRGQTGEPVYEHFLVDFSEKRLQKVRVDRVVGHVEDDDVAVDNPHNL